MVESSTEFDENQKKKKNYPKIQLYTRNPYLRDFK